MGQRLVYCRYDLHVIGVMHDADMKLWCGLDGGDVLQWGWPHDFHSMTRTFMTAQTLPIVVRSLQKYRLGALGFAPAQTEPIHIKYDDQGDILPPIRQAGKSVWDKDVSKRI